MERSNLFDRRGVTILPVGDAAVMALLGDRPPASAPDLATVQRVWVLSALARQRLGDYALDVVPGFDSVLVRFDPSTVTLANVMATMRGAAAEAAATNEPLRPRNIQVGVCFGGERGADFDELVHSAGLTAARYIETFCAAEYRVAFLGFLAGFPYLIGLPPALAVPRLPTPRDRVPAGSVAIAGLQCGIYPRSSPGGWRLIGRTNASIFDPAREVPALFQAGDRVRFESVKHERDAIAEVSWP